MTESLAPMLYALTKKPPQAVPDAVVAALLPFAEAAKVGLRVRGLVMAAWRAENGGETSDNLTLSAVDVGIIAATRQLNWVDFQRALDALASIGVEQPGGVTQ